MRSRGSPSPCPTVTIGILNSRYNHFTFVKLLSVLLILFLLIACQPVAGLDAERTIRGHAPAGGFTSGIGAMLGRPRRAVAMRAMDQERSCIFIGYDPVS